MYVLEGFGGPSRATWVAAGILTAGAAAATIYYLISQRQTKKKAAAEARRAAEEARRQADLATAQSERNEANTKALALENQAITLENQVTALTRQIMTAQNEGKVSTETAASIPASITAPYALKAGGLPSWIWLVGLGVGAVLVLKR